MIIAVIGSSKPTNPEHVELAAAVGRARAIALEAPQVRSLPDPVLELTAFISPPETRVGPQRLKVAISTGTGTIRICRGRKAMPKTSNWQGLAIETPQIFIGTSALPANRAGTSARDGSTISIHWDRFEPAKYCPSISMQSCGNWSPR